MTHLLNVIKIQLKFKLIVGPQLFTKGIYNFLTASTCSRFYKLLKSSRHCSSIIANMLCFWGWVIQASSPNIGFLVPFFLLCYIWINFHLSLLHCTCLQMPFFTHRLDVLIDMTLFQKNFDQKLNILQDILSLKKISKVHFIYRELL